MPVNMPAILLMNGGQFPVTCLDLSRSGARVRSECSLAEGTSVVLKLSGLPDLAALILDDGTETGLRFTWQSEDAPRGLSDWLDRKAA
jgi:hypothetical protein